MPQKHVRRHRLRRDTSNSRQPGSWQSRDRHPARYLVTVTYQDGEGDRFTRTYRLVGYSGATPVVLDPVLESGVIYRPIHQEARRVANFGHTAQ